MKLYIEQLKETHGTSKKGKAYTLLNIRSHGEFYSAFRNQWNAHWKAGMEIEAEVEEEVGANGKIYKNLKPSNQGHENSKGNATPTNGNLLNEINTKLDKVIMMLAASTGQSPDDIPF